MELKRLFGFIDRLNVPKSPFGFMFRFEAFRGFLFVSLEKKPVCLNMLLPDKGPKSPFGFMDFFPGLDKKRPLGLKESLFPLVAQKLSSSAALKFLPNRDPSQVGSTVGSAQQQRIETMRKVVRKIVHPPTML